MKLTLIKSTGEKIINSGSFDDICNLLGVSYDFGCHKSLDDKKPATRTKYLKEILKGAFGIISSYYWRTDVVRFGCTDSNYFMFGLSTALFDGAELNDEASKLSTLNKAFGDVVIVKRDDIIQHLGGLR